MIDCGEPIGRSFKNSGLSYDSVDRVFLSHLHADHYGGFFMLMQGFWLERRRKPLTVNMPGEGIKAFKSLLEFGTIFPELLEFKLRFEALRAKRTVSTNGVRITPFRTTHLDQLKRSFGKWHPCRFEAFSFLIEADGLRIAHSADIGAVKDLDPLLAKPLDLLVCELAHFQAEDLFAYLKGRAIRKILFIHVARPYWENREKLRRRAARMLGGIPFTIVKDGDKISI